MTTLNLEAKDAMQRQILDYLASNVTDSLADKINNGVSIEKDGKQLINKKTLDGFISYAIAESQKITEKGARGAFVSNETVYGWAMHYFEEDSIEGTLYNLDGTPYTAPPKRTTAPKQITPPKPSNTQLSLFDMDTNADETDEAKTIANEPAPSQPTGQDADEDDYYPTSDEIAEILQDVHEQEQKEIRSNYSFYNTYVDYANKYPQAVIAIHVGDFYEVYGGNAVKVADELNLTLTSRQINDENRVPMVGFPYHATDIYFKKINAFCELVIVENNNERRLPKKTDFVDEDGVIHDTNEIEDDIIQFVKTIFGNEIIITR